MAQNIVLGSPNPSFLSVLRPSVGAICLFQPLRVSQHYLPGCRMRSHRAYMEFGRHLAGVGFLLLLCGSQESNSGPQAWHFTSEFLFLSEAGSHVAQAGQTFHNEERMASYSS